LRLSCGSSLGFAQCYQSFAGDATLLRRVALLAAVRAHVVAIQGNSFQLRERRVGVPVRINKCIGGVGLKPDPRTTGVSVGGGRPSGEAS
jgi:hypothetical protein